MSKYIVVTSFYEGNTLHEAGQAFEHTDKEYVAKCLTDGNIVEEGTVKSTQIEEAPTPVLEEEATSEGPLVPQPVEPVASEAVSEEPQAVQPVDQPTASQIQEDIASVESSGGNSIEIQ